MNVNLPAIEVEVYAPGLREDDRVMQLNHQLDLLPQLRHKLDVDHEIVYFEADAVGSLSLGKIAGLFHKIGVEPRFVGEVTDLLPQESPVDEQDEELVI